MPLYEYRCQSCEHQFEIIQKFSDQPIAVCPQCGNGPVVKLMSSPAFQFKGSGWYITDYARKDKESGTPKEKSDRSSTEKSATEAKDAKPAAESSTPSAPATTTTKSD